MSIKFLDNEIKKLGGKIIFIPDNCDYLQGKVLDVVDCKIYCYDDELDSQLTKTIYGVMLSGGSLSISGYSVIAKNISLYCSGNLEIFAKKLSEYCRKICGKEEVVLDHGN